MIDLYAAATPNGRPTAEQKRPRLYNCCWMKVRGQVKFYNATLQARDRRDRPTLADLVTLLREGERPGGAMQHEPEPRSEWIIDELRFTTRQEAAAPDSSDG